MAESHLIHLCSDDSKDIFPDNIQNSFSNKLVQMIHFREKMSVSLTGFEFSNLLENYDRKNGRIVLFYFNQAWPPGTKENPSSQTRYGIYFNLSPRSGFYSSAEDFIGKLNLKVKVAKIKELNKRDVFFLDPFSRKCTINLYDLNIALIFRGQACKLIGLSDTNNVDMDFLVIGKNKEKDYFYTDNQKKNKLYFLESDKKRWRSDDTRGGICSFPVSLDLNNIFYIYLDILEPHINGSSYCKLLKKMNSNDFLRVGERTYHEFTNLNFQPISTQCLNILSINIKNHYNKPVKFLNGSVIITLLFKPTRYVT